MSEPAQAPARPRRRWRRWLRNGAIGLVLLLVIVRFAGVALLPSILDKVVRGFGLTCSIGRLEVSLLSGEVELAHVAVAPIEGGEPILALGYVRADVSVSSLLVGNLVVRRLELDGLDALVERDADGRLALEKRVAAHVGSATSAAPDPPKKSGGPGADASSSKLPSVSIEALRVAHVHIHVRDASVAPPLDAKLELDVSVLDVALNALATRPGRIELQVAIPPLLDSLRVEGQARLDGTGELTLALDRLHLEPLAPYLEPLGIRPVARELSFGLGLTGHVEGTAAVFSLQNVALTADGKEALALDTLGVSIRAFEKDRIEVARVLVDGVRASAIHLPDGALRVAGLELRSLHPVAEEGSPTGEEAISKEPPPAAEPPGPAFVLDELTVSNVRGGFYDEGTHADLALLVPLIALRGLDTRRPDVPARLEAQLSAPGVVESIAIVGTARPFGEKQTVDASVSCEKLTLKELGPYLAEVGVEPLLKNGRLSLELHAAARRGRAMEADVRLEKLGLLEGESELAGIDAIRITDARIDPEESRFSVGSIEVARPRLGPVWRDASGALVACGFKLQPGGGKAEPEPPPPPAHDGSGRKAKPPHLTVGKLSVHGCSARFADESVVPAARLALADAGLELGLLDVNATPGAPRPRPAPLRAWVKAPGLVESIDVTGSLSASPRTPALSLAVEANGITARAAAPYLALGHVASRLEDGKLALALHAEAKLDEAGPVTASVAIEDLHLDDGPTRLLGVSGLRVKDATLDPSKLDRIDVGLVELEKAVARVALEPAGVTSVLGFALSPAPESIEADSPLPPPPRPTRAASPGPAPLIKLAKLHLGEVGIDIHEASEEPAFDLPLRAGLTLGPLTLDAAGKAPLEDTPFKIEAASPGALESLVVEGHFAASSNAARLGARVSARGITAGALRERLAKKGIEPRLRDGTFGLSLEAKAAFAGGKGDAELHVKDVELADGDELAGIDEIDVDGVHFAKDALTIASGKIRNTRASAARDAQGAVLTGGFRFAPHPREPEPEPAPPAHRKESGPFVFTLGALQVEDATARWSDAFVAPATSLTATTSIVARELVVGDDAAPPARIEIHTAAAPFFERFSLEGSLRLLPARLETNLELLLEGVNGAPLAPYLAPAARPELESATLRANLAAVFLPRPEGSQASLAVTGLDWRDGERELLHLDLASVKAGELSPQTIGLESVTLFGLATHAEKTAEGETRVLGLLLAKPSPAASAPVTSGTAAPVASAAETAPMPVTTAEPKPRGHARKPPLIALDHLHLHARELAYRDESQAGSEALIVSNLNVTSEKPIRLLGPDPASQPPIEIKVATEVAPIASSIVVTTRVAPFALDPDLAVTLAIDGLRGAGLTRVAPDLAAKLDGSLLKDGRVHAEATLQLRTGRRDPLDFDLLARGFGLDLDVRAVDARDGKTGPVLLGLDELHVDVARIDSAGNVRVRAIEVAKPAGLVRVEKDGVRVLDILLKPGPEEPAPAEPLAEAPETDVKKPAAEPTAPRAAESKGPELRVDRVAVTDIAFTFEDRSTEFPMIVPLTGLDVNVSQFTTRMLEEKRSVRFEVVVKGGKITLPKHAPPDEVPGASALLELAGDIADKVRGKGGAKRATEERPCLRELAVKGELALFPSLAGTIDVSVDSLELANLKGPLSKKGTVIDDGVLDLGAQLKWNASGDLCLTSKTVITDLEISESREGWLRKKLELNGPLNEVQWCLRDDDGAIEIEFNPAIPTLDPNMSPKSKAIVLGQHLGAAVLETLGKVVARALLRSPFRALKTGTAILGDVVDLIPGAELLNVVNRPRPVMEPIVLHFAPGDPAATNLELAKLDEIAKRLEGDELLVVSLRHETGGGDLARERVAANPSPRDRRDILARLGVRRADLERERRAALEGERLALRQGLSGDAERDRARGLELELATVERALDQVFELEREGAERQAERRTRAACVDLANARLEAVRDAISGRIRRTGGGASESNAPEDRIRISRPRVEDAEGDAGGTITLILSPRKKR